MIALPICRGCDCSLILGSFRAILALAATACIIAASPVSAGDRPTRPRVVVTQFGEPDGAATETPAPGNHVTSELVREFSALDVGGGTNTVDRGAGHAQFLRLAVTRVPAWMRTGKRPAPFPESPGGLLAPSADCLGQAYAPSSLLGRYAEGRRRILYPLVRSAACEAGLPVGLMDAMLIQESRYNPLALSPKGAFGLGQLMPGTAQQLEVDRYDMSDNLAGAARYLRQQIDEFGQIPLALAAYNAGPGRVRKIRSIPRIAETQRYVRQILSNWRAIEATASLGTDHRLIASPPRGVRLSKFR